MCFFDLETRNLMREVYLGFDQLSFSDKNNKRLEIIPKLGLATAYVLSEKSVPKFFDEGQERELIAELKNYDKIVGHNIIDFDYLVLLPYFISGETLEDFREKTIDTLEVLRKVTGQLISLDDLAENNLDIKKSLDPMRVPELWRSGKKEEVRSYCKQDVEILRKLYDLGKKQGRLAYTIKEYGEIKGIGNAKVTW